MRYTLELDATVVDNFDWANPLDITWPYDFRTLIPVQLRGKKFMLYSSFETGGTGEDSVLGIRVQLANPLEYNKTCPEKQQVSIGVAATIVVYDQPTDSHIHMYMHPISECNPLMIEYPDWTQIKVRLCSWADAHTIAFPVSLKLYFDVLD